MSPGDDEGGASLFQGGGTIKSPLKSTKDIESTSFSKRESRVSKRYQILESQGLIVNKTLGQGAYATVKAAYDVNRKNKVAVKVITKKKTPESYLAKFLPREIEVVRILKHPCLITFYQVIETTSRFFLVMELAEKGDLLEMIKANKYIPEDQAAAWFRGMHDGILYMHGRGIVHRDLKCENLLLDGHNNLKVTDFGFARRNLRGKLGEIIYSETYCGSYAYASPEILKGVPYNAFLSDVWSMGVILFTMVYGRLPFDDTDHKKLLVQVQTRVPFPSKPEVSEECRILILKMLMKGQERIPINNIMLDNWFRKKCRSQEEVDEESRPTSDRTGSSTQTEITNENKMRT